MGISQDAVYVKTYEKSRDLADKLLDDVGSKAAALVPGSPARKFR